MKQAQETEAIITHSSETKLDRKRHWMVLVIQAFSRCLRPSNRKRSFTLRFKKETHNQLVEKEIIYNDEY